MTELPRYDDLPSAPDGGRSGWGMFGSDDQVGTLNLLTPDVVQRAAGLVRRGAIFPLNAALDAFDPPIVAWREHPRRELVHKQGSIAFDDRYSAFYPQGSSQWDGLGHIGYAPNAFYNGAAEDDVAHGRRNGIEHWARRGIAGRAVVLDMPGTAAAAGRPYDPGAPIAFSVPDLEQALAHSNVLLEPGDIVVLHTGFARWYTEQSLRRRQEVQSALATPGLAHDEDVCRYLWDHRISAVVSDNLAVEVTPIDPSHPTGFLHRILIGQLGMALGELWWTDDLVADCAADGVYEAFLVSAPLHAVGGLASPANALAIK